jgi:hypothetical protein
VLLLLLAFIGSRFLLTRAIKKVVGAFRDNNALTAAKAMSLEDLGLVKRGMLQFEALRDYRPMALQLLIRSNIIQQTKSGHFFLSEETLAQSMIKR